jgi:hypothetical protein
MISSLHSLELPVSNLDQDVAMSFDTGDVMDVDLLFMATLLLHQFSRTW